VLLKKTGIRTIKIWGLDGIMEASHSQKLRRCHIFHRSLHLLYWWHIDITVLVLLLVNNGSSNHKLELMNWRGLEKIHGWRELLCRYWLLDHRCECWLLTKLDGLVSSQSWSVWDLRCVCNAVHDVIYQNLKYNCVIWNTTLIVLLIANLLISGRNYLEF
jgi:hypothetical protein